MARFWRARAPRTRLVYTTRRFSALCPDLRHGSTFRSARRNGSPHHSSQPVAPSTQAFAPKAGVVAVISAMVCFVSAPFLLRGTSTSRLHSAPSRFANRVRRNRPVRAVLTDDPSKSAKDPDASYLPAEQLEAYYASDDSSYQPELAPAIFLAFRNFRVELADIRISIARRIGILPPQKYTPPDCLKLTLDDEKVLERERQREQAQGTIPASAFVNITYNVTCRCLDILFKGRPVPRFWFLETVARMPYFAYSSCLHLFSTLGWYRSPTLMNVHHAEELNEAYHLAVMESLGGDRRWFDRFLAFHASIVYYWFLVVLFMISPADSYRFSQKLEGHAADTYGQFLEENETRLRQLPVPDVAYEYFANFMYYFQEFQLTDRKTAAPQRRSPTIESLYDVFENILRDEREHTQTMDACSEYIVNGTTFWYNGKSVSGTARKNKVIPLEQRQEFWRKWEQLNTDKNEE